MSKFTEFLTKYNGKFVEVSDPSSPNQCFDLTLAWTDFLGIPRVFPFRYAYQIYSSFGPTQAQYFDRIYNDPQAVPKEGDIMVWNWYYNYAGGHTGIFKDGDVYKFNCFVQNDPTGSYSYVKQYNYNYVSGWLRPKNYTSIPTSDQLIKTIKDKINTNISDSEFRNWERTLLGV